MILEEITFEEILPVWRDKLWPGRVSIIEPASSMLYLGGYDVYIKFLNQPRFFAVKHDGEIIGVNSGHQTDNVHFRSRGIYTDIRYKGVGRMLIDAVQQMALEFKCTKLWSCPRQSAMPFYEACGFKRTTDYFEDDMEFGPNCYCLKELK
jgi:GNAT superfamily N-acetyltransferase